jgi:hypothetical protein
MSIPGAGALPQRDTRRVGRCGLRIHGAPPGERRQTPAADSGVVGMKKHRNNDDNGQTNLKDLAIVTYVSDMDQAREYETVLRLNDIPAMIKEKLDPSGDNNVAILVPEDYLDEAHVVIESQNSYDDFYDFSDDGPEGEDEMDIDADYDDEDY